MDVHEEMYNAAATTTSSSRRVEEADDDETDLWYDQALRSRPQQDYYGDFLPVGGEGYDFFNHSKNRWGIAVGIVCIGLVQFYAPIWRWIRHRVHRWRGTELSMSSSPTNYYGPAINTSTPLALLDGLIWLVLSVLDYLWVAYQIMVHTVRDRCWRFYKNNNSSRQRSRSTNGPDSRSRCNSLPELEDCSLSAAANDDSIVVTMATTTAALLSMPPPPPPQHEENVGPRIHPQLKGGAAEKMDQDAMNTSDHPLRNEIENWDWGPIPVELEPAFLTENRYPPNWLVYHPKLRVVPRTDALRYDATKKQSPPLSETKARHSATNGLAPDGGGSLVPPSLFEDEKKDDNIVGGHDNLNFSSTTTRPLESNTNLKDCSPTPLRRANEPSRQQPLPTKNNKGDMPIRRSVVAT